MDELLQRLENKIQDLIHQHQTMKDNNHQLAQGKSHLTRENEILSMKQQRAIMQIEGLVAKLKLIGNEQDG